MNRRIDPGSAVTALVLIALFVVAAVLSPKAVAPPPTPEEVLDSALQATFGSHVLLLLETGQQTLAITVLPDSIEVTSRDSNAARGERIARFANANYHGAPVEAITVRFLQRHTIPFSGAYLTALLDGHVTPVTIDPRTFHARQPAVPVIATRLDSLVIDPMTLRPIEEWYGYPRPDGEAHVMYDGAHIHGSFDTTLTVAPFAAGDSIYVVGVDSVCRCWSVNTAGLHPDDFGYGFRRYEIKLEP